MSIIVSPGVYTQEIDFSLYVPQLAQSILGIVGTATKGPVNEVTLITDEASLIGTFGPPAGSHLGLYAAIRYLRKGKQLKFVRVAQYDQAAGCVIAETTGMVSTLQVDAVSTGSWGSSITVTVAAGSGLDPDTGAATYKISISYNNATAEVYDLVLIGPAYTLNRNYITTRINGISEYIAVTILDAAQTTLELGSKTCTGGDDGAPATDGDYIGTAAQSALIPATGLQLFADPEQIDVNMLAVPDVQHATIINEMITICQNRADCIALIDVPQGKSVQQAVAWMNGLGGGADDPTAALNSTYAAVFYPWLQVYDGYNDANVWIPPSGHIAGVIAYTDYVADSWWAPAGLQRGLLSDVLDVEHSASQGERDYMYSNGNAVNPIINYPGQGIVVWGQRTASRTTSALDRINVRRLLLYLRKAIATAVRVIVFQPNDEDTWADFRTLVNPICSEIKGRRGVYDYSIVCDATTNTAAVIARNEMRGKVMIKPTKAAEMISIDFVVLNNQAQFAEF